MTENYRIRELLLGAPHDLEQLRHFLQKHELTLEPDIEAAFGLFDLDDHLVGCGCAAGRLLKCFAVNESLRGQNATGLLVSHLTQNRFRLGYYNLFVITRSEYGHLFTGCGLSVVVQTDALVMLENCTDGPETFIKACFLPGDEHKTVGAIVMNCNPFTLGHRALIAYAAGQCEVLHIFVVEEDRSAFSADVRLGLVRQGVADLHNVRVHLSGPYIISAATFPTYFLKQDEDMVTLQSELDITLFADRIAPPLHITKRFAGQEPLDPATARYNRAMADILPSRGIAFCEVPRLEQNGTVISASRVRKLLQEQGVCPEVLSLVPETTAQYLLAEYGKPGGLA